MVRSIISTLIILEKARRVLVSCCKFFVVPVNALVSLQIRVQDLTAQVSSEIPDDSELSLLSKTKLEQDFKKYVTFTCTGLKE